MPRPSPIPDPHTKPFWDAVQEHRLAIQACTRCDTFQHPPGLVCKTCQCRELEFRDVTGDGTLYSFTVSEQSFVPGFEDRLPLAIGLVQLDVQGIVRLLCNIEDRHVSSLEVDMPMRLIFEQLESGSVIPQFEPA
jgi:hypothetical protein